MGDGPKLVIIGTALGSLLLAFVLSFFTARLALAAFAGAQPAAQQQAEAPSPAQAPPAAAAAIAPAPTVDDPALAAADAALGGCTLSPRYPAKVLAWCDLITAYAQSASLDPNLVAAVIWLESGGNAAAYSRSGAVGLMQVMPSDGLAASFMCINGPCFSDRPTIAQLNDPEFNIRYGVKMLARLFSRHQDLREALKAYGPGDAGYSYADKVLNLYERYGKE